MFISCLFLLVFTTFIHVIRKNAKRMNERTNKRIKNQTAVFPLLEYQILPHSPTTCRKSVALYYCHILLPWFSLPNFCTNKRRKRRREAKKEREREDEVFLYLCLFFCYLHTGKETKGGSHAPYAKNGFACVMCVCVRALQVNLYLFVSLRVSLLSSCLFFLVFLFFLNSSCNGRGGLNSLLKRSRSACGLNASSLPSARKQRLVSYTTATTVQRLYSLHVIIGRRKRRRWRPRLLYAPRRLYNIKVSSFLLRPLSSELNCTRRRRRCRCRAAHWHGWLNEWVTCPWHSHDSITPPIHPPTDRKKERKKKLCYLFLFFFISVARSLLVVFSGLFSRLYYVYLCTIHTPPRTYRIERENIHAQMFILYK